MNELLRAIAGLQDRLTAYGMRAEAIVMHPDDYKEFAAGAEQVRMTRNYWDEHGGKFTKLGGLHIIEDERCPVGRPWVAMDNR